MIQVTSQEVPESAESGSQRLPPKPRSLYYHEFTPGAFFNTWMG